MAESTHTDPFYTATANEANTLLYVSDELAESSPKITADTLMRSSIEEFKRDSTNWSNLNNCRKSYAGAYVVYNKEKQAAKGRVNRTVSSVKSFFLPKELDVEKVAEDESAAAKALKDSKSDYDNWKYQYADALKGYLQDHGFESDQIDSVLKEEVIFDEYSRWRQERAKASVEDKKVLVKKTLEWYRKSPVIQRAAVGAVLGVGAFAAVSGVATFVGIAGVTIAPAALIIRGGARFASAVAASLVGTPIGTAVISKATDLFSKIQPLEGDIFSSQDEFIKAAQQYETGVLKKENAKRLVTIGSAVVIGILVGGYTSHVFADNLPHVVSTTGGGTGGKTGAEAGTSGGKGSSAAESAPAAKPKSAEVATKETPVGKKSATKEGAAKKGAASGKKVNYTDLIEDETGPIGKLKQLKLWGKQHTASLKGIKKLFGLDENSHEAKKIADFYDKGYISKKELPKLKELLSQGDNKITVEEIDRTVLYHPQTPAEFEHYFAEKQTNLSKLKDEFHLKDDHIVRDQFTGEYYIDQGTGKFLYTGGKDLDGEIVNIAWQDADGKWIEPVPPSLRPPSHEELKLIKQAYEKSENAFTDAQKNFIASKLLTNETGFTTNDVQTVINMQLASAAVSTLTPDAVAGGGAGTKITLDIGASGPEGAMIKWLKENPTEVDAIAKKLGISDSNDYGRIAHKSWLESMKDPKIKADVEKMGLSHYVDTEQGNLAGMRHISQGKVIIDPNTGKMSFSEDTRILPSRPKIHHTSHVHTHSPEPIHSTSLSSTMSNASSVISPISGTAQVFSEASAQINKSNVPSDAVSHGTESIAGSQVIEQVLKDGQISLENYRDFLKTSFVKTVVSTGSRYHESAQGKMLEIMIQKSGLDKDFIDSEYGGITVEDFLKKFVK